MTQTNETLKKIIGDITFGEWVIALRWDDKRPYLQVQDPKGVCNVTGDPLPWGGRKWMLSYHMTDSEVVRTAWKAVQAAVEHEAAEKFRYKKVALYDPHIDVNRLVDVITDGGIDVRPPMKEDKTQPSISYRAFPIYREKNGGWSVWTTTTSKTSFETFDQATRYIDGFFVSYEKTSS